MTAIRFAASLVLGLVATTSAFAAEPNTAPAQTSVATTTSAATAIVLAAGPAAVAYKAPANARYCFRMDRPGSRIMPKVCKTRADWEATGVDLDAALAGR